MFQKLLRERERERGKCEIEPNIVSETWIERYGNEGKETKTGRKRQTE